LKKLLRRNKMATTLISDKDGNTIDSASATVPSNRLFRDAWSLSGKVITEDLTAAKVIFKEKIREVRKPLLEAQDALYMRALEDNDTSAKAAIKTKKTALRNAPAASKITNANSVSVLKNAWDTTNLGTNPYA
jgi:hypothetical protein